MKLSSEDTLLLSCVKLHPNAKEVEELNHLLPLIKDWENLCTLLIVHGSAPLFCKKLPLLSNNKFIPAVVQSKLQQTYYKTLSRSMLLYRALDEVVSALHAESIDVIVLKGAHLSELLYKDIALRQFSDIDILVQPKDGEKSLDVLIGIGFNPRESKPISEFVAKHSDFVHYSPMEKGDVSVEVHIKLHMSGKPYELCIPDIWSRAKERIVSKHTIKVLNDYDLLMHLCIHADKHFQEGHIQMKSFNDIVNLLDGFKIDFDWEHFETLCKLYMCEKVVYKYFLLLAKFYNAYLPEIYSNKYAYCLTPEFETKFIAYLHGDTFEEINPSAIPGHINSLRYIKSPWLFLIYVKEVLFPSKAFMIQKYNIGSQPLKGSKTTHFNNSGLLGGLRTRCWFLWYPYRWWVGVKGLVKLVFRKALNG